MGFLCTPQIMGLTRDGPKQKKNGGKQKHRAAGKAILAEAGKERFSASETLDRTRSGDNSYSGFDSGFACWDAMCKEADEYRVPTKARDGTMHERGLRKDAVIGYAIIFNPPSEMTQGWTRDDYQRFYDDSWACLREIQPDLFRDENVRMDAVHRDEGRLIDDGTFTEHLHRFGVPKGRDGKYCGNRIDARLLITINERYPAMMRDKGWDLDDLQTTDWQRMRTDEEYRREWNDKRKERGRSVNKYIRDELDARMRRVVETGEEVMTLMEDAKAAKAEADDYARHTKRHADEVKMTADDTAAAAEQLRQAALRERQRAEEDRRLMLVSAQQEAKQICDDAQREQDEKAKEYQAWEDKLSAQQAAIDRKEKQARADAQAILKEAQQGAEALTGAARAEARQIVAKAKIDVRKACEKITEDAEKKSQEAIRDAYHEAQRKWIGPKVQSLYDLEAEYHALIDSQKQLGPEPEASLVEFCKSHRIGNRSIYDLYQEHRRQADPSGEQRQANREKAAELDEQIEAAKDIKQADPVNDPVAEKIIRRAIAEHGLIRRTPDTSAADAIDQTDGEELEMV